MKTYKAVPELQTLSASTDGWFYDGERETSGCTDHSGYVVVCHKGKRYRAHRLIAKTYLDGSLPLYKTDEREVDHREGRQNNSVENLRIVDSHKTNCNLPWSIERYSKHNSRIGKRWGGLVAMKDGQVIREFGPNETMADVAEFLGKTTEQIRGNLSCYFAGRTSNAYGYQWVRKPKILTTKQQKWKKYLHEYHIRKKVEKTIDELAKLQ